MGVRDAPAAAPQRRGGPQRCPNWHLPPPAGGMLRWCAASARARSLAINPAHPCVLINGDPWIRKDSAKVFYNLFMRGVEVTAAEAVTVLLAQG